MNPSILLPYSPQRDAYRLLGVEPDASIDEIVGACRRLTRTFHPDHNRSPRATREMQVVNAVRRVLTDQHLRSEYDTDRRRWLAAAAMPPPAYEVRTLPDIARPSAAERYARAVWSGLRATLVTLAPSRCADCRMVIAVEDAYCAACGTRLLTA